MNHPVPRKSLCHKNADLHGSAPDKSEVAVIIVDVINDFDFPEAKQLARFIPELADKIARLKRRAKAAKVPVIYVNDNFGRWRSDFRALIEHCREGKARSLIEKLYPKQDDYFVLKPKHSGFFSSTLETLLRYLGVRRLIITGIAGNFCVLFNRERRLHTRLRTGGPLRLRYFEYRKGEQRGFAVDETLSESRYPPFPPHYFWKTILAAVQQRTGPSELIASERLQMCRAILPGTANSYDTNEFAQKIAAV